MGAKRKLFKTSSARWGRTIVTICFMVSYYQKSPVVSDRAFQSFKTVFLRIDYLTSDAKLAMQVSTEMSLALAKPWLETTLPSVANVTVTSAFGLIP